MYGVGVFLWLFRAYWLFRWEHGLVVKDIFGGGRFYVVVGSSFCVVVLVLHYVHWPSFYDTG